MGNEQNSCSNNYVIIMHCLLDSTNTTFYTQVTYCHQHDEGQVSFARLSYQSKWPG